MISETFVPILSSESRMVTKSPVTQSLGLIFAVKSPDEYWLLTLAISQITPEHHIPIASERYVSGKQHNRIDHWSR